MADIADAAAIQDAVVRAEAHLGRLDVVVANAGAGAYGRFTRMSREDFERTVAVTLFGTVNTVRAALPALERTAGTLVVTGSVATRVPLPLLSPYVTAKHGVRGFVNALRAELRADGSLVRIAVVDPGPVNTPFWDHVAASEGELPPRLPAAYSATTVARTLRRAAARPHRDRVVGGAMLPLEPLFRLTRPLADVALAGVVRGALGRGRQPGGRGAIWEPSGDGFPAANPHGHPVWPRTWRAGLREVSRAVGALRRRAPRPSRRSAS